MAKKRLLCFLLAFLVIVSLTNSFNYGGVTIMDVATSNRFVHILIHDAPFSVGTMTTENKEDLSKSDIPLVTFPGLKLAPTPLIRETHLISVVAPHVLTNLGLKAPDSQDCGVVQIPVPVLTDLGKIKTSEFGTPILSEHSISGTQLTTTTNEAVLTNLGTPVYVTPPIPWTPNFTEDSLLALLGECDEVLNAVVEPSSHVNVNDDTSKLAQERPNERRRDKQKQFQAKRERYCSHIRAAYDRYVEAEYAYTSYVHFNGEIDESYALKCKYEKSLSILDSAIKEYNNSVKNATANFVLSTVDNIIHEMLISDKRSEYFNDPQRSFIRERLISLEDLIYYLLTLDRKTGEKEIFDFFWDNEAYIPSAAAMNQQRHKLKPEGVRYLFITLAKELTRVQYPTCKNYRILGADGTDSNTWYNENAENFMEGKNGNKGFNQNHIVTIVDMLSGIFLDCVIQPRPKTNETKAATEMVKRNKSIRPSILVADRGFASFNLVETCRLNGMEVCFRIREDFCKESKNMPLEEHDEVFTTTIYTRQTNENKAKISAGQGRYLSGDSPYGKYKKSKTWDYGDNYSMSFRIVRFSVGTNKDGSTIWETIITTLPKDKFSIEDFKELYHLRWSGVEVPYRYLKYAANLSYYHSKLPEFTEQEIYARFAMYNICQTIINIAVYGKYATNFKLDLHGDSASKKATFNVDLDSRNDKAATVKNTKKNSNNENQDESSKENNSHSKNRLYDYQINHTTAFYIIFNFVRNKGDVPFDVCNLIKKHLLPIRNGRMFEMNISPQSFRNFWYR